MPKGRVRDAYSDDYRPLMRGALVALRPLVKDGTPAPSQPLPAHRRWRAVPSVKLNPAHSRARDGEGVPMRNPAPRLRPRNRQGIISKATAGPLKDRYACLVPSVDADGNRDRPPGLALTGPSRCPPAPRWAGSVRQRIRRRAPAELCYLVGAVHPVRQDQGGA